MKQVLTTILSTAFLANMAFAGSFKYIKGNNEGTTQTVISDDDTKYSELEISRNILPRGSALLTHSGKLAEKQITHIIHAASGSMNDHETPELKPTLEGVKLSIKNSIRLANKEKIKKIAIPLVGGGIFLSSMGITGEELAYEIVNTAMAEKGSTEIVFVAYSEQDFDNMKNGYARVSEARQESGFKKFINDLLRALQLKRSKVKASVVRGNILDINVHGASVIVNAANTEVQFGGGLSGIIGNATEASGEIDELASQTIKEFYLAKQK